MILLDDGVRRVAENPRRLREGRRPVHSCGIDGHGGAGAGACDPSIDQISAADLGGEYPAVQYTPPDGHYSMDILSRLGTAFRYEDLESEVVTIEGVSARVATPRMLYRMKKDTVRPQDRMDAETIRNRFGIEEKS